jgi:hypothetical protein
MTRPDMVLSQPGASFPELPVTMMPLSVMVTMRFSAFSLAVERVPARPELYCGSVASTCEKKATVDTVMSKNMIKFMTMSKNGMMFSSESASEGSSSWYFECFLT